LAWFLRTRVIKLIYTPLKIVFFYNNYSCNNSLSFLKSRTKLMPHNNNKNSSELSVQKAGLYKTFLVGAGSWTRGFRTMIDELGLQYSFPLWMWAPNYSSIIVQTTYFILVGFWNYLTWHWHENIAVFFPPLNQTIP
jgi:hypothetical protein